MGVIEQVWRFDEDLRALRNERHHVSSAQIPDRSAGCSSTGWPTRISIPRLPRPDSAP